MCVRKLGSGQRSQFIKQEECVWFTTNQPLLFKQIFFSYSYISADSGLITSDIEIIEYKTKTFATNVPFKVLKMASSVQIKSSLDLATPIITKPNKLYNIRLAIKSKLNGHCHYSSWATEVKLNDRVTINFHQNEADSDSARRGFIKQLCFNQI